MPTRIPSPFEQEARRCAMHLVDLIQTATVHSPRLIIAIDQAARAFVAEDRRRELKQRIAQLDADQLAQLDGLLAKMDRTDEPENPDSTSGSDDA